MLAGFCLFGFAAVIFLSYYGDSSNRVDNRQEVSHYRHPKLRAEIKGFRFDGIREGKKTISIKADSFRVEKKKLGFFRFGLMNEARLENAAIDIYGQGGVPEEGSEQLYSNVKHRDDLTFGDVSSEALPSPASEVNSEAPERIGDQTQRNHEPEGFSFEDFFSKDALRSFSTKRICSIVLEPVNVKLHDGKSVVTEVSATSAIIRLKKGDIVFRGDVRVVSGSRVLTTDHLTMHPDKAVIGTDRRFVLKTPEKRFDGEQLTTDIFLRRVNS